MSSHLHLHMCMLHDHLECSYVVHSFIIPHPEAQVKCRVLAPQWAAVRETGKVIAVLYLAVPGTIGCANRQERKGDLRPCIGGSRRASIVKVACCEHLCN